MSLLRNLLIGGIVFSTLITSAFGADLDHPPNQPNIIYIMLDDLDYIDLGAYGSPDIMTETIDSVAKQGMRFEQYYTNGPVCSPTRASIITGQYPARFGIKRAVKLKSNRGITAKAPSIALLLQNSGYRTAHIGKWHIGTNKKEFLPSGKGYEQSVRLLDRDYLKYRLSIDDSAPDSFYGKGHLTRVLTDSAIEFVRDSVKSYPSQPFYLNLWYLAPHAPLQPPADFDNSKTGYCLNTAEKAENCDYNRGRFAALVTNADREIKRLLNTLEQLEIEHNTLLIITSDNGGSSVSHANIPPKKRGLSGFKGSVLEGGIRVPMIIRWPAVIPHGTVNQSPIASFDLYKTLVDIMETDIPALQVEGESFYQILTDNSYKLRNTPLVWENKYSNKYFSNLSGILNIYAVRHGDWKLIFTPGKSANHADKISLFNIKTDKQEKHNLYANPRTVWSQLNLLDYNLEISSASKDTERFIPHRYQLIVDDLQHRYFIWRQAIGDLNLMPKKSPSGVISVDDYFRFSGGVATIDHDTRLDFDDGDFSFLTTIRPKETNNTSVISEKIGSWRLFIEKGSLQLEIQGNKGDKNSPIVLKTPIAKNVATHVAFTAFSWRDSQNTFRLYVNGILAAEARDGASIDGVKSNDDGSSPMIYIGNNSRGNAPFHGDIHAPRMSVLSLYPSEIFQDYAMQKNP